jgi:hypothetical protein
MVTRELQRLGECAVDASSPGWSIWRRVRDEGSDEAGPRDEWLWDEHKIGRLLDGERDRPLFIAGCAPNQGDFRDRFDRIVLLTTRPTRMIERLEPRWDLRIAEDRFERYLVLQNIERVLPRLRTTADLEIDTTMLGVSVIVDRILAVASDARATPDGIAARK